MANHFQRIKNTALNIKLSKKTKKGYPTWDDVKKVHKKRKSLKLKSFYNKIKIYIFLLLTSLNFVLILPYNFELNNARYILSSIAQGLASLLALLFVIIFFLCQTIKRISILSRILNPDGYILLTSFIVSIMLPLLMLKMEIYGIWIEISIALVLFCLLSLIPLTNRVNLILKQFGISNTIFELMTLEFPQDNIRYMELMNDLMEVGIQDIVKLEPQFVLDPFIEFLENNILNGKIPFSYKGAPMHILSEIAISSIFLKEEKEYFYKVIKDKINELIFRYENEEYLSLGLTALSQLLSNLKFKKLLTEEICIENATTLIRPLFNLYHKAYTEPESLYKERLKKVENVMVALLRREILSIKNIEESLPRYSQAYKKEGLETWKEPFEKYIKKLAKSAFKKASKKTEGPGLDF